MAAEGANLYRSGRDTVVREEDGTGLYERDVFASSGHGSWAALAPETVALKGSSRILVDSENLLDALTSSAETVGEDVEVRAPDYFRFHKHGTGRMPARNPAPDPDGHVVDDMAGSLLDAITEGR